MKTYINNQVIAPSELISINNNNSEGQIVQRYNIPQALLESYFIPSNKMEAYQKARSIQDLNAQIKFGIPINISRYAKYGNQF